MARSGDDVDVDFDFSSDDDDSSRREEKRRSKSSKKHHHKKKSKKKHRKDDSGSSGSDEEEEREKKRKRDGGDDERRRRKKDHKREKKRESKKEKKKKEKRRHRGSSSSDDEEDGKRRKRSRKNDRGGGPAIAAHDPIEGRNAVLADALCDLFRGHPPLSADLPIMLIRMAGGTVFDLAQMTDAGAAMGLARVFEAMTPFGVMKRQDDKKGVGGWGWTPPVGAAKNKSRDSDLILVRVVRAALDQAGITTAAVDAYENSLNTKPPAAVVVAPPISKATAAAGPGSTESELAAEEILKLFGGGGKEGRNKMAQELAGLCAMILEGESIALDGLPDEKLRSRLERLFTSCGLEKSELAEDDDDDDDDDDSNGNSGGGEEKPPSDNDDDDNDNKNEPTMGYGLPDENDDEAKAMIAKVVEVCRGGGVTQTRSRPIKGPALPGNAGNDDIDDSDDDEEEGPSLPGAAKGPALPPDMIKARAAQRAKELARVKIGLGPSSAADDDDAVREEWMLVPGKFDFLGSIKAGKTIRSRTFEAKSKAGPDGDEERYVDPSVRAEITDIRRVHEEFRGPSLMEVHRQKRAGQAEAAAAAESSDNKKSGSWTWNRDKNLDEGRRVDKDALKMVLGGAASDLKTKFHGGFG